MNSKDTLKLLILRVTVQRTSPKQFGALAYYMHIAYVDILVRISQAER